MQKFDSIPLHSKIRLNEYTLLQLFLNCTDLLCEILHRFDRYTKTMFLFLAVAGKWLFWQVTHVGLRDENVAAWISNNGLFIGAGWYGSGIWCAIYPDATYRVNADYVFCYFRHLQAIIPALLERSWINVDSVLLCWINVDSIMIKRYFLMMVSKLPSLSLCCQTLSTFIWLFYFHTLLPGPNSISSGHTALRQHFSAVSTWCVSLECLYSNLFKSSLNSSS